MARSDNAELLSGIGRGNAVSEAWKVNVVPVPVPVRLKLARVVSNPVACTNPKPDKLNVLGLPMTAAAD